MRMRKKKHLDERLEACGDYFIKAMTDDLNFETSIEKKEYFDFKELFGNDNPVELEIGCGKGGFVNEKAKQNPDINFLAVEKIGNVIVSACEAAKENNLPNVRFLKCSAEYLEKYIKPKSIARIYLNFSCPYPKNKYKNHRLTNRKFLKIYSGILADGAEIHQKTDNMHFFEYSLEEFSFAGFKMKNISLDLHKSDFEGNIVTEYEKRFSEMGFPIYRLEAYIGGVNSDE